MKVSATHYHVTSVYQAVASPGRGLGGTCPPPPQVLLKITFEILSNPVKKGVRRYAMILNVHATSTKSEQSLIRGMNVRSGK